MFVIFLAGCITTFVSIGIGVESSRIQNCFFITVLLGIMNIIDTLNKTYRKI
jgi:hypothetical protein